MPKPATTLALIIAGALACAQAQWLDYRDPRTPRTKDGSPNLACGWRRWGRMLGCSFPITRRCG